MRQDCPASPWKRAAPPARSEEVRLPYADTPDGPLYYEHVNFQPPWQVATRLPLRLAIGSSPPAASLADTRLTGIG